MINVNKNNILESWIMVEHLSEGDINKKDVKTFQDLENEDYYNFFLSEIEKEKICDKGGVVVFIDIFPFEEVIEILRNIFGIGKSFEEITSKDKFSVALYFDNKLSLNEDMTFYTESAYIRQKKEVPENNVFHKFENDLKEELSQDFDKTAENPEDFNKAFVKVIKKFGCSIDNCRVKVIKNLENGDTNLHSFFIDDLEKAKEIETDNLIYYLHGAGEEKINLDSKKESDEFNSEAFIKILQPSNYPNGRFPSNTEYALSFMQQVAVNLAVGFDNQSIRSVNGPPGTGKTTLLKDIFAELIVKQAYEISNMSDCAIKGTEATKYWDNASIGVLPQSITDNEIIVASSNNGAVQNIVNELPLVKDIDEKISESLKNIDYFRDIANSKVIDKWNEDENGDKKHELALEPIGDEEERFWGQFSLEGGKNENMSNILNRVVSIVNYLNDEYIPIPEAYGEFLEKYEEVALIKKEKQEQSNKIQKLQEKEEQLNEITNNFENERTDKEKTSKEQTAHLKEIVEKKQLELDETQLKLNKLQTEKEILEEDKNNIQRDLDYLREHKPGLLSGRDAKNSYKEQEGKGLLKLQSLKDNEEQLIEKIKESQSVVLEIQSCINEGNRKIKEIESNFANWETDTQSKMSSLKEEIETMRRICGMQENCLDLGLSYEDLQIANPWFDEEYRLKQSELFVLALKVRKNFLYENRKNLKAAKIIWSDQSKYLENKQLYEEAFHWLNMAIPVISSTFASFSNMCKNLGKDSIGHLFVDEAGQALPQAAVGAIFRSKNIMVVGDPAQIKPVLTMDSAVLTMLGKRYDVGEKYLSESASVQTLVDSAGKYGYYKEKEKNEESWIGIPLWVHRRCAHPMFDIANKISYNGMMVQGNTGKKKYGKSEWIDVSGNAEDKFVKEQGDRLRDIISKLIEKNSDIIDKNKKDVVYVISPFRNVAFRLSEELKKIKFTRYDKSGKPTNVGTIHTFQGKEAPIVFLVLGADNKTKGAASWAVSEANMMNVAATRAKEEFYIIGDRKLYSDIGSDVVKITIGEIEKYNKTHQEHEDDNIQINVSVDIKEPVEERKTGIVKKVGLGKKHKYAYIDGVDGIKYVINEDTYAETADADLVIQEGKKVSFVLLERTGKNIYVTRIEKAD